MASGLTQALLSSLSLSMLTIRHIHNITFLLALAESSKVRSEAFTLKSSNTKTSGHGYEVGGTLVLTLLCVLKWHQQIKGH